MEIVNHTVINLIIFVLVTYFGCHVLAVALTGGELRRVMSIRGQGVRRVPVHTVQKYEPLVLLYPSATCAYRRRMLTAAMAAALMLCMAAAKGVAPRAAYLGPQAPRLQESIQLPVLRDQLEKLTDANAKYIREERMQRGETIASVLKRIGLSSSDVHEFIRRDLAARNIFNLQPGQRVRVEVDQRNMLVSLQANLGGVVSASRELSIERIGDLARPVYVAHLQTVENELHYEMRSGSIGQGGFFYTMDAASVPDDVAQQLPSIFAGLIDFHRDIVIGDRFRIVYEAGFREGAIVSNGRVAAVELIIRDQLYQALWYSADGNKEGAYYTFDGRSMKRPFLHSPVEFSRVSSGFGGRDHPLHHHWTQHKGVDFAAPIGTKVLATADGIVNFIGRQNGYGNIVILKHHNGFSTFYAHLSGFGGIHRGEQVTQGQLIGYVGKTGRATGPHLHYEVRFNDMPQNPLSTSLMDSFPLKERSQQQFLSYASDMLSRINALRIYDVASNQN